MGLPGFGSLGLPSCWRGTRAQANSQEADDRHFQQQKAVAEATDLGRAVGSIEVADGQVDHPQSQAGSRKQQFEVPERVKIAKIGAPLTNALVIFSGQQLGAAQAVTQGHLQDGAQSLSKKEIAQSIEEAHSLAFHGISQAIAVDKITD